jgi:CRISPR-associated protein Csb2
VTAVADGIQATFLLGTFTGHRADRSPDPLPDPARLHAALLNAAGQGSTAVSGKWGLTPSPEAIAALQWLEVNPPDGIRLPHTCALADRPLTAFRREGVILQEGGKTERAWVDKVTARPFSDGRAVDGPIGWCWSNGIPAPVRQMLDELCADVSCLGESTSPVRLELTDVDPTHYLDENATMFDAGGTEIRVAGKGRTELLIHVHEKFNGNPPSAASDRHTSTDRPAPPPAPSGAIEVRQYRANDSRPSNAPWSTIVLLPTSACLPPASRVMWCTALHRALVGRIGFGAPPMVTGHYPKGVSRPANRLAIQYLPARLVAHHGISSPAFALLIPAGAEPEDLSPLSLALAKFPGFNCREGRATLSAEFVPVSGEQFWQAPLPGYVRRWITDTVAIPETSPQRRGSGGSRQRWTLRDAARVSIGLVWRDVVAPTRANSRWFEEIAARTADFGVEVHEARIFHTSEVATWVHKTPEQVLVQPYRATVNLGSLAGDRTLVAIGQSRHLGGGLLVPIDSPAESFA